MTNPALRSFDLTALDAGDGCVELADDFAGLLHTGWKVDDLIVVYDLTNRRNNRCRTTETTLLEALDLLELHWTLIDRQVEIMLCDVNDRTSGDGRKNRR